MKRDDAVYARYSSHRQDASTSIDVQLDAVRTRVPGPCREYIDKAKTGRSVAGRENLIRLLDDARGGLIGRVFTYKYDRLGRNMAEVAAIVDELEDLDVEVISLTEGRDALARGVHLAVAEYYSRQLSERTLAGLMRRFEEGRWTGGCPPYGYRIEKIGKKDDERSVLAIDAEEAEVVKLIFDLYVNAKLGLREMAQALDSLGIRPRRSESWEHTSVRGIIVNRLVTGHVTFNRRHYRLDRATGRRRPRRKDIKAVSTRQDESLRIISDETFEAAQRLLASRGCNALGTRSAPSHRQMRAFTGLLVCCECGRPFYAQKSSNAKAEYTYYRCGTRKRKGPGACPNAISVREDILVNRLSAVMADVLSDDGLLQDVIAEAERMLVSNRDERASLQRRINAAEGKVRKLTALLTDTAITESARSAFFRQIGEAEEDRRRAQEALAGLGERAEHTVERIAETTRSVISDARRNLTEVSTPQQFHDLVEEIAGRMVVQRDGRITRTDDGKQKSGSEDGSEPDGPYVVAGAGFEPATF